MDRTIWKTEVNHSCLAKADVQNVKINAGSLGEIFHNMKKFQKIKYIRCRGEIDLYLHRLRKIDKKLASNIFQSRFKILRDI